MPSTVCAMVCAAVRARCMCASLRAMVRHCDGARTVCAMVRVPLCDGACGGAYTCDVRALRVYMRR